MSLIPIDEISVFRADQKYVVVEHDGGEDLIDESLKSLEEEFGDRFVRIHRSALVALERIDRIEKSADGSQRVVMRGGRRSGQASQPGDKGLIISRRHAADVRRRLKGR